MPAEKKMRVLRPASGAWAFTRASRGYSDQLPSICRCRPSAMRSARAIHSRYLGPRRSSGTPGWRPPAPVIRSPLGCVTSTASGGCPPTGRPLSRATFREACCAWAVSERSFRSFPEVATAIAASRASFSLVKGCTRPSPVPIVKTAAWVRASIPLSTKSRAAFSARRLSSRLIRSKTSVTRLNGARWPSTGAPPTGGGSTGTTGAPTAPAAPGSIVPCDSTRRNDRISQRWSFSKTCSSSALRSRTGRPFLSRAITSRRTTAVPVRNSGAGWGLVWARAATVVRDDGATRATERTVVANAANRRIGTLLPSLRLGACARRAGARKPCLAQLKRGFSGSAGLRACRRTHAARPRRAGASSRSRRGWAGRAPAARSG